MIEELARAKINLFLHVGPRRADGLHEIESLFVFADDGDRLSVKPSAQLHLGVTGPCAGALEALPPEKNLAWKAAALLQEVCGVDAGAAITLDKRLPAAAGIGGGSADAAAALRALVRLWDLEVSPGALEKIAFHLGADVPACLYGRPVIVRGAGERVVAGPKLPPLWIALVNPGVEVATGPVFKAFDEAHRAPSLSGSPAPHNISAYDDFAAFMSATRNDLEPFARAMAPQIDKVLDLLQNCPGVLCARMSGSGATCFGLFSSRQAAQAASRHARAKNWWAMAAALSSR